MRDYTKIEAYRKMFIERQPITDKQLKSEIRASKPCSIKRDSYKRKIELQKEQRRKILAPCLFCGYKDLRAIHLHHLNKKQYPDVVIPLCANCHTIYHKVVGVKAVTNNALEVITILKAVIRA